MSKLESVKQFFFEHKYGFIGSGFLVLVLFSIITYFFHWGFASDDNQELLEKEIKKENIVLEIEDAKENSSELCQIKVDVKGEVLAPGLYQLDCNSRVQDVIDVAGGITWQADTSVLNLGKKLEDEMVIVVYSKEQVANFVTTKKEEEQIQASCQCESSLFNDACTTSEDFIDDNFQSDNQVVMDTPVDSTISLNKATKEELMQLPGIGASKAEAIILYRQEIGRFQSIEEIKQVKGIGDSIFEKIKESLVL